MNPVAASGALLLALSGFSLRAPDGGVVSFDSLRGAVTVVVFTSAVCPIANDYADRFNSLYRDYQGKGVRFVFVNSNRNETAAEVRANAEGNHLPFPIYRDEGNVAADRFEAQVTPTAYVLDGAGKIRYQGAFDDAVNPPRVKRRWVREAVEALLDGRPVAAPATQADG